MNLHSSKIRILNHWRGKNVNQKFLTLMVSHATSTQPSLRFDVPVPECAITSRLLGVSLFRLHWTINSREGRARVPISAVPECQVEGVGVQKSPHLLLDVPQVLPAKRHPGHKAEEAVQTLETRGWGHRRMRREWRVWPLNSFES